MCLKSTEEGCVLKTQMEEVKEATAKLDTRLTQVEHDVGKMRSETQEGIRALNLSVDNLAHDFGQRFNNIEATVVSEKVEWGKTLRKLLTWTVAIVLSGCAVAMGVHAYQAFFK